MTCHADIAADLRPPLAWFTLGALAVLLAILVLTCLGCAAAPDDDTRTLNHLTQLRAAYIADVEAARVDALDPDLVAATVHLFDAAIIYERAKLALDEGRDADADADSERQP